MRRRFLHCSLLLLGGLFLAAGWYVLTQLDAVSPLLHRHRGDPGGALLCTLNDLLPCGAVLGYVGVGLGAWLVAIVIGLPPVPEAAATAGVPPRAGAPRWPYVLLCMAVALAALGSGLSIRTRPGTWPPLLWLATLLLPIPALMRVDRQRGTRLGNPFPQRREWAVLLLIVALDLLLVGHDMTHWRWSGTPDETSFFEVAKSIAVGASERPLLSEAGVFMFQPVLSSFYPALFMRVFGVSIFAWKLSSAVALAGSLPFLYLFTRELWNRRTAVMAALFFGSAPLAVGFSHFGYNNVQVYPIVAGGLGVLAWAHTRRSLWGYYLAGCIAGVGFYTYYTARAVAPLLVLLIWSSDGFPLRRAARAQTAAFLLGLGLAILPIFSDLDTLLHNMQQLAISGEQATTPAAAASRVLAHWLVSLVHGLWFPQPHHFQSNPIDNPIAATCTVIGWWLCVGGWRRANGRFLAAAYLLAAFLAGATSQHFRPPLTRLLFLSPLTAVLAAVGADQLLRAVQGATHARQTLTRVAACTLLGVSVVWSTAALQYSVRYQHHGYAGGTTAELIRMAQLLPASCRIIFVQQATQDELVHSIMEEYGMGDRLTYRRDVDAETLALVKDTPIPVALFAAVTDPEQRRTLETAVTQRFPTGSWRDSDPRQPWNLRYFDVCGASRTVEP
jgi:4-amino-4-deoxy-L-arabinose transferase-like glycosyltransferase